MDPPRDLDRRIAGISALDQPLRRDVYRYVAAADGWVSRDQVSAALGVPRSVAAFHLDKLADAGVVEVRFERTSGRQGPGAGRPSKLYRRSQDEVAASIPERRYDLAGSLLATAVAESSRTGAAVRDCLRTAAQDAGRQIGQAVAGGGAGRTADARDELNDELVEVLARHGYEPATGAGEVALANCPFHRLAEEHRELVCGMNLDFLDGVVAGLGATGRLRARLDPAPGYCCVRIGTA